MEKQIIRTSAGLWISGVGVGFALSATFVLLGWLSPSGLSFVGFILACLGFVIVSFRGKETKK